MIVNDGPVPAGYYDQAGRFHFYDPERAIAEGRLRLGDCAPCAARASALGALTEAPGGVVLMGIGMALLVGWGVWMVTTKPSRRR